MTASCSAGLSWCARHDTYPLADPGVTVHYSRTLAAGPTASLKLTRYDDVDGAARSRSVSSRKTGSARARRERSTPRWSSSLASPRTRVRTPSTGRPRPVRGPQPTPPPSPHRRVTWTPAAAPRTTRAAVSASTYCTKRVRLRWDRGAAR